jgi:hypothetical protein
VDAAELRHTPRTLKSSVEIAGFTAATAYFFRVRGIAKPGKNDLIDVLSLSVPRADRIASERCESAADGCSCAQHGCKSVDHRGGFRSRRLRLCTRRLLLVSRRQ